MDIRELGEEYSIEVNFSAPDKRKFSSWIRASQKEWGDLDNDVLAPMLDLTPEQFKKMRNRNKKGSRDFVIALTALLGFSPDDVSDLLRLYGYSGLDEMDARDLCIWDVIEDISNSVTSRPSASTINKINDALKDRNLETLQIIHHRSLPTREDTSCHVLSSDFEFYKQPRIIIPAANEPYLDIYDSLSCEYDFGRCDCSARAYVVPKHHSIENPIYYELVCNCNGKMSYIKYKNGEMGYIPDESDSYTLNNLTQEEIIQLKPFASILQDLVKKHRRQLVELLNDTRNYGERVCAGIKNDCIHVFCETYNYDMPEAGEYYLMEYVDRHYQFSIYHASVFLALCMNEEEYKKKISKAIPEPYRAYKGIDEIEKLKRHYKKASSAWRNLHVQERAFKEMQSKVNQCLERLRNRTAFVNNYIANEEEIGGPAGLCRIYGVESPFRCHIADHENGEMALGITETDFVQCNGDTVHISIDDLQRAFELGAHNIDEICHIIKYKGSIESILT